MIIVYRHSDKAILNRANRNNRYPDGGPAEVEMANVINAYGGSIEDYDLYRLHDIDDADIVASCFSAHSYALVFENNDPVGVETYPRIIVTSDVVQITADGLDKALITADVQDDNNTDLIEFFIDGESVGSVGAVEGVAALEFSAESPGQYVIEALSKTPGPPGFEYKYGRNSIIVEAI